MKSQIITAIIICCFSIKLVGQNRELKVGLSVGANSSNVKKKDGAFVGWNHFTPSVGYLLMSDLNIKINSNLSINAGIGYELNKFSQELSYGTEKYLNEYELNNINFPLMLQISSNRKINFFTNVGIQVQEAFSNRFRTVNESTGVFTSRGGELYSKGFGVLLGLGLSYNVGKKYHSKIETRLYRQFNRLYNQYSSLSIFPKYNVYSFTVVASFSRRFAYSKHKNRGSK